DEIARDLGVAPMCREQQLPDAVVREVIEVNEVFELEVAPEDRPELDEDAHTDRDHGERHPSPFARSGEPGRARWRVSRLAWRVAVAWCGHSVGHRGKLTNGRRRCQRGEGGMRGRGHHRRRLAPPEVRRRASGLTATIYLVHATNRLHPPSTSVGAS